MYCVLQGEEILSQRSQGSDDDDDDGRDGVDDEKENQRSLQKDQSDDEVRGILKKEHQTSMDVFLPV